jgi:hypothetical protein
MTRRERTARRHDPTWECDVCVASASSSSEPEPAPRHRDADAQRRGWLEELAEARRQFDEELALLHQELGMDAEPRDRQLAHGVPVQGQTREGNDDRRPAQDIPVQGNTTSGMATGASAVRVQTSRTAAHLRRRHAGRSLTTTDTPMVAQTPMRMLTHHHFFCGRPKTLPLQPCCCTTAWSPRPPRSASAPAAESTD